MGNKYTAEIGAKDAGYTSTIKQINKSTESMDGTMKSVSSSVNASFASMAKAGAAFATGFGAVNLAINAVKGILNEFGDAMDLGAELSDLSKRTGETTGNLLIMQTAFDNAGSSAENVGPTINKLQKFMYDAAQGGEKQIAAMANLGISLQELKGKTPLEQMQIFAKRISEIKDPTDRSASAIKVFGKSGGELLPMLSNFSGEIEEAKIQLGSMPDVMNRSGAAFDEISTNLSVIRRKMGEFAAGLFDRLAPAIQFATTMMMRFDAAAAGMKLGDIIKGAGNGISAFNDALKALQFGEMTMSWQIAFAAFKLSAAESFNSIYKNIVASMSAAGAFIKEMFGLDSGILGTISLAIDVLGLKLQKSIASAFLGIAQAIPGIGGEIARSLEGTIGTLEAEIALGSRMMQQSMSEIPNDFVQGIEKAGDAFDKSLKTAKDLIDTTEMQARLDIERAELQQKIEESIRKQGLTSEEYDYKRKTLQEQYKKTLEVIAKLENEIKEAKMLGDDPRVKELERQLAIEKLIAEEIKNGKTYQEALAIATEKQNNADANVLANKKEQTKELKEQLSLSQEMAKTIEEVKQQKAIDPLGRLQEKFSKAQAAEDISGMERVRKQIENREINRDIQQEFRKFRDPNYDANREKTFWFKDAPASLRKANFSVSEMAKELGIERAKKTSSELRREIMEELKKRKGEEEEKAKKEAPATPKETKQEQQQERLGGVVGEILGVCKEIAGKLPQHALGY